MKDINLSAFDKSGNPLILEKVLHKDKVVVTFLIKNTNRYDFIILNKQNIECIGFILCMNPNLSKTK